MIVDAANYMAFEDLLIIFMEMMEDAWAFLTSYDVLETLVFAGMLACFYGVLALCDWLNKTEK